jgi:hypothetical protein
MVNRALSRMGLLKKKTRLGTASFAGVLLLSICSYAVLPYSGYGGHALASTGDCTFTVTAGTTQTIGVPTTVTLEINNVSVGFAVKHIIVNGYVSAGFDFSAPDVPAGWTVNTVSAQDNVIDADVAMPTSTTITYSFTRSTLPGFSADSYDNWLWMKDATFENQELCTATPSNISVTAAPVTPAPTLSGVLGDTQNVLSWSNVTVADSYELFRDGVSVYTGTDLTYTDTGLTNGTPYGYNVVAINTDDTSDYSNTVTLTPAVPPPPPSEAIQMFSMGLTTFLIGGLAYQFRFRG